MIQFNPDGSIKLPGMLQKRNEEHINKLKNQRCIKIRKEIISNYAPKSCSLHIQLSDMIKDNRFIETTYNYFKESAKVDTKLEKINEKEFKVTVGTAFSRCSDCNSLIRRLREFLDGNIIEDKGTCTFKSHDKPFSYEDYFD